MPFRAVIHESAVIPLDLPRCAAHKSVAVLCELGVQGNKEMCTGSIFTDILEVVNRLLRGPEPLTGGVIRDFHDGPRWSWGGSVGCVGM